MIQQIANWLHQTNNKTMTRALLEKWEQEAISAIALDERINQLREAIAALDASRKNNRIRIKLENDVIRAARGVVLPLRKDNPLSDPPAPAAAPLTHAVPPILNPWEGQQQPNP